MKLAYITLRFPFPLTSGRLRQYHLIRQLKSRACVKLICVSPESADEETQAALNAIAGEVLYVCSRGLESDIKNTRESAKLRLRDELDSACREHAAEVVCSMSGLPLACMPVDTGPLLVDFCDAEWFKALEKARLERFPDSLRWRVRAYRTRRYERRLARLADHAFFAAPRDAERVLGGIPTPYNVLPNGVDAEFWRRSQSLPDPDVILFAGAFSYQPNVDAAIYLAREIFPLVQKSAPRAQLVLAGRDPPPELKAFHNAPTITVTGFVPDIRPYHERATVFVAPLRVAGGIQNKLLEAMAMETPVVASTKGVAGLGLSNNEIASCQLEVRDDTEGLAAAVVDILRRKRETPGLAPENRAMVTRRYSWEHASAIVINAIEKLIAQS
ncbi:MAG: glycosyltransferase [Pirellulales bacterium]|nr:glycosyltransferase [Pirellulales bacterium]